MGISDLINNMRNRNSLASEMANTDAAQEKINSRKLSANERELNEILRKEREALIRKELEARHKKDNDDFWHKDTLTQPNLFNRPNGNFILKIRGGI